MEFYERKYDGDDVWYNKWFTKLFIGGVLVLLLAFTFATACMFWFEFVHGDIRGNDDDDNFKGLVDIHTHDDDDDNDPASSVEFKSELNVTSTARFGGDVDTSNNRNGIVDGIPRFTRNYKMCPGLPDIARGQIVGWYTSDSMNSICATQGFKDTATVALDSGIDDAMQLEVVVRSDGSRDVAILYMCNGGFICWRYMKHTVDPNVAQPYSIGPLHVVNGGNAYNPSVVTPSFAATTVNKNTDRFYVMYSSPDGDDLAQMSVCYFEFGTCTIIDRLTSPLPGEYAQVNDLIWQGTYSGTTGNDPLFSTAFSRLTSGDSFIKQQHFVPSAADPLSPQADGDSTITIDTLTDPGTYGPNTGIRCQMASKLQTSGTGYFACVVGGQKDDASTYHPVEIRVYSADKSNPTVGALTLEQSLVLYDASSTPGALSNADITLALLEDGSINRWAVSVVDHDQNENSLLYFGELSTTVGSFITMASGSPTSFQPTVGTATAPGARGPAISALDHKTLVVAHRDLSSAVQNGQVAVIELPTIGTSNSAKLSDVSAFSFNYPSSMDIATVGDEQFVVAYIVNAPATLGSNIYFASGHVEHPNDASDAIISWNRIGGNLPVGIALNNGVAGSADLQVVIDGVFCFEESDAVTHTFLPFRFSQPVYAYTSGDIGITAEDAALTGARHSLPIGRAIGPYCIKLDM